MPMHYLETETFRTLVRAIADALPRTIATDLPSAVAEILAEVGGIVPSYCLDDRSHIECREAA